MTVKAIKKVEPVAAPVKDSNEFDPKTTARVVESMVLRGDISALSPEERAKFYLEMCEALGLTAATQPFAILRLNGKEILYPTRGATDQLAAIHRLNREIVDGPRVIDVAGTKMIYAVCRATHPNGRVETAVATVPVNDPLNGLMKCECVPLDSEILTRDGWKTHDQLTVGEEVLAYDTEKDQCRWTPLEAVSVYQNAPVSELHSPERQFSVRCTPNHKWAARKPAYKPRGIEGGRGLRGPYQNRTPDVQLVEAWDLNTSHKLVLAAPECETEQSLLEPAEAAVLGWMITDGTHQKRGSFERIGICQSKPENFAIIRETVAQAAGMEVNEVVSEPRTRTFATGRTYETLAQHWWYLPAEVSRSIFKKADYSSREDLPRIVTRLSPKARAAMLQAMMLAEADERGCFANGDRHVMDAFEILSALQGKATGERKNHGPIWTKRLKKTRHVAANFLALDPAGTADVWCPTTKFGTWVMRQNGRVMITGNTKAKRRATLSILGLGMLDETEIETIPAHVSRSHVEVPQLGGGDSAANDNAPTAAELPPVPPAELPSALQAFQVDLEQIELPAEAVSVWIKHRAEIAELSAEHKEAAWKALCARTEVVGKLKNAKVWLKRAIAEEDARRTASAAAESESGKES
jgi:hypothetical protein